MPRATGDQNVNGTLRCLPEQSGRKWTPKEKKEGEEEDARISSFFFFSSLGLALRRSTDPLDPLEKIPERGATVRTLERAGDAPVAAGREELVREDGLHRPVSSVREKGPARRPVTRQEGSQSRINGEGRWDTRGARRDPRRLRTPSRRWTGSSCDARIGYVHVCMCACVHVCARGLRVPQSRAPARRASDD
jgi:hypothetical protein